MTKEEAIHILRDSKPSTSSDEEKILDRVANVCFAIDMAIKALKERKTGKWIEIGYVENDNYNFMCSECRYTDTHTKAEKVNYCWHCGAKMEASDDSNNN